MNSFFARQRLSAYLDGELTVALQGEVERAVAADPALARELEEMRAGVERLRTLGRAQAPAGFTERALSGRGEEGARAAWRPRATLAAALALAAVPLGLALTREAPSPSGAPEAAELSALHAEIAAETPPPAADEAPRVEAPEMTDAEAAALAEALAGGASADAAPDRAAWEPAPETGGAGRIPSTAPVTGGAEDAPFQTSWEQAGLAPSLVYRFTPESGDALYHLDAIAQSHGGALTDSRGGDLEIRSLPPGEYASIKLEIPASQLPGFVAELEAQRLGELREASAFPEFLPDGSLSVELEIYRP